MQEQILPGDLLVVWGPSPIEKGIENVTHGPSHVAIFLNQTQLEEAQGGRAAGECDLSFYTNGDSHLEVWSDPTLTDDERSKMVEFAHSLYGKKYDYVLIALEFLHSECKFPLGWYHNTNAMICSGDAEACAESVDHRWSKEPNPSPADLIRGGTLVKKGVLTTSGLTPA